MSCYQIKKDLIPRVRRWWLQVQDYNFEVEYRSGKRMRHTDALSRQHETDNMVSVIDLTERDWIEAVQSQDENIRQIKTLLEIIVITNFNKFVLKGGKVYKKLEYAKRVSLADMEILV